MTTEPAPTDAQHDDGVSTHTAKRLREAMQRLLTGHPNTATDG